MNIIQLCGIGLCTVIFTVLLKERRGEMAVMISLAGGIFLFGAAVSAFVPSVEFVSEAVSSMDNSFSAYISVLLKALGIASAVQITADICRDAGESSVASKVELAGKAEILLISLPMVKELLTTAYALL